MSSSASSNRETFRGVCREVAYQKELRDRYAAEPMPPVPHLDLKRATVRRISRHLAEQIILKYEWLGTMAGTNYHYGIFFGDYCAGVCCVSVGSGTAGAHNHTKFSIERMELATLARGACVHWAPPGTNSKLVSFTARLLAKETKAKVLIAYSDSEAGEVGTIYQACNWICIGLTQSLQEFIAPSGRILNRRMLHKAKSFGITTGQYRDKLVAAGWRTQYSNPKYRYVWILDRSDRALVERIEAMRVPYPKRAASILADASTVQAEEQGAAPMAALQVDSDRLEPAGAASGR